ncbi:hypothetical protein VTK56DRAFT_5615 [Thermocarpiscus australiensis]
MHFALPQVTGGIRICTCLASTLIAASSGSGLYGIDPFAGQTGRILSAWLSSSSTVCFYCAPSTFDSAGRTFAQLKARPHLG